MCKRSENKLYNVVLLKFRIYAFIIKKDKALLVENVELKVEFPFFCSGLKLRQVCYLQTACTGPKLGVGEITVSFVVLLSASIQTTLFVH